VASINGNDRNDPEAFVDAELDRLQVGLRQLKVQYDMFFAGSIPRQPFELRSELERTIKRLSGHPIRKYSQRFHLASLVSRFNAMSELWTKTLRTLEEGDRPTPTAVDRARAERLVTTCRVQDPSQEEASLKLLHARFVDARRKAGEGEDGVSFRAFVKGIVSQTRRLKDKTGCEEIELRIVVQDRKVQLKARPGR
jgi:hypothetical protein